MELPNMQYADNQDYRYGFNGKENDKDWGTASLTQDYGFRLYNPAIAKFLSVDPLAAEYPFYTPYQFAGNMPINSIDLDGAEPKEMIDEKGKLTRPMIALLNAAFLFDWDSLHNSTWVATDNIPFADAQVRGRDILYDDKYLDMNKAWGTSFSWEESWFKLVIHEQAHRDDIAHYGTASFYGSYVGNVFPNIESV